MKISIPELCLVVLIGPSGSGKSTFARTHFRPTEILSSDSLRGWVSDDETDQSATDDAFEILHLIARKRLARGRLTVVDATSVQLHAPAVPAAYSNPFRRNMNRSATNPASIWSRGTSSSWLLPVLQA